MGKALSRAEAATILTALCRKKLVESGFALAAFGITESEVTTALAERIGLPEAPESSEQVGSSDQATAVQESSSPASMDAQVQEVWGGWLTAAGQPITEIDLKSKAKIEERLAFGFTAAELIEACKRAIADPGLVKRTSLRSITRPLETDRRVCALLGKVYVRPTRITWLTPFEQLWLQYYPASEVPYGLLSKVLSPLVAKHGAPTVLEEAEHYLRQTNIAYISWPKFAQGFGTWGYGQSSRGPSSGRESYAGDALSGLS